MAERPMVGCQVPPDWKMELEAIAQRQGTSVSQLLHDLIADALNKAVDTGSISEIEILQNKIEAIEAKTAELATTQQLTALSEQLEAFRNQMPEILTQQALAALSERLHPFLERLDRLTGLVGTVGNSMPPLPSSDSSDLPPDLPVPFEAAWDSTVMETVEVVVEVVEPESLEQQWERLSFEELLQMVGNQAIPEEERNHLRLWHRDQMVRASNRNG